MDEKAIKIDREQAFLLYATFTGDVERTAHALGVKAIDVLRVVDEEKWTERLKPIIELKKSNRPGDVERAINRALNFVQCHRLRLFLERVLNRLCGMELTELEEYLLQTTNVKGETVQKLSTRALADLASAIEKAQAMTYLALSDTAQDRAKRAEADDGEQSGGELHAKIAAAMSAAGKSNSVRAQLLDAQLATSAVLTPQPIASPLDNDDH